MISITKYLFEEELLRPFNPVKPSKEAIRLKKIDDDNLSRIKPSDKPDFSNTGGEPSTPMGETPMITLKGVKKIAADRPISDISNPATKLIKKGIISVTER